MENHTIHLIENPTENLRKAKIVVFLPKKALETKGIEQSALAGSKTPISEKGGAKCGAVESKNDPDLQLIIDHWPTLPEHIKAAIKALVGTHIKEDR